MDHRLPPKPPFYNSAKPGHCRVCGLVILNKAQRTNVRASWHPRCLLDYKLIHWPAVTRRAVWSRDHGKCAICGGQCARRGADGWHMDHIKPLIEAQGQLDYWRLPNLQTTCMPCHYKKTGLEATARAIMRRILTRP
jgi:5-methylcytosine-specific restriction endonuclease McrA